MASAERHGSGLTREKPFLCPAQEIRAAKQGDTEAGVRLRKYDYDDGKPEESRALGGWQNMSCFEIFFLACLDEDEDTEGRVREAEDRPEEVAAEMAGNHEHQ